MYRFEVEDLSQKVYRALKEMILKNEIKPGERLHQEELAERFGISRTPILQAISKLEKEMLLELLPRKGAFVKKYSHEELLHIYDIRMKLEPLGAREAAMNATEQDKKELSKLGKYFEVSVSSDEEGEIRESDYALHMKIMEMSKNNILFQIISAFNIVVLANWEGLLKEPAVSIAEHKKLIAAIADGDADTAEKIMFDHIRNSRNTLAAAL